MAHKIMRRRKRRIRLGGGARGVSVARGVSGEELGKVSQVAHVAQAMKVAAAREEMHEMRRRRTPIRS